MEFVLHESQDFVLEETFRIKLSTCDAMREIRLCEEMYKSDLMSGKIGCEGCFILDFIFNKGGSEALAETYFGIMKSLFKTNSSSETADMRSLVGYCYPNVSNCPRAIDEIDKIYREGCLKNKVVPHRSPIFYDSR